MSAILSADLIDRMVCSRTSPVFHARKGGSFLIAHDSGAGPNNALKSLICVHQDQHWLTVPQRTSYNTTHEHAQRPAVWPARVVRTLLHCNLGAFLGVGPAIELRPWLMPSILCRRSLGLQNHRLGWQHQRRSVGPSLSIACSRLC